MRGNERQRAGRIVLVLSAPIAHGDIPGLCEHARTLLERSDAALLVCDVSVLVHPDAVTVDTLARLQLTARRLGRRVRLRNACVELLELLSLAGLREALPLVGGSGIEPRGQTEEREQAHRVEEESDPGDPTV
jgi:ABC-type transporter Mla MlaB component